MRALRPAALLVNCLPPANVTPCLAVLASSGLPFGCYANLGAPDDVTGFRRSDELAPEGFADCAASWLAAGARLVGGCCGTTPEHIRAIARRLHATWKRMIPPTQFASPDAASLPVCCRREEDV